MMKLELMKQFYETVDEGWRSPIASTITPEWFGDGAETCVWRASANFVCVVAAADRKYYLRFNHENERQPEFIAAELDYIEALVAAGLTVAIPVRSRGGNLLESVSTSLGLCHAVMFEALPGEQREFDSLAVKDFESWGRALGQVHASSAGFSDIVRPTWSDHVHVARRLIPCDEELARRELDAVEARLSSMVKSQNTYGLIHYDFELDNLMWEDDRIGILDFDDCATTGLWLISRMRCGICLGIARPVSIWAMRSYNRLCVAIGGYGHCRMRK